MEIFIRIASCHSHHCPRWRCLCRSSASRHDVRRFVSLANSQSLSHFNPTPFICDVPANWKLLFHVAISISIFFAESLYSFLKTSLMSVGGAKTSSLHKLPASRCADEVRIPTAFFRAVYHTKFAIGILETAALPYSLPVSQTQEIPPQGINYLEYKSSSRPLSQSFKWYGFQDVLNSKKKMCKASNTWALAYRKPPKTALLNPKS